MAQLLFTALRDDMGSVPNTTWQLLLSELQFQDTALFLTSLNTRHAHGAHVYMRTKKTFTYIK